MTKEQLLSLLNSLTLEEKVGQLVQCNAGQFIQNQMEITGPEGELLPAEDLNRVMGSVLTFEDASQAKALQDKHLAADSFRAMSAHSVIRSSSKEQPMARGIG